MGDSVAFHQFKRWHFYVLRIQELFFGNSRDDIFFPRNKKNRRSSFIAISVTTTRWAQEKRHKHSTIMID